MYNKKALLNIYNQISDEKLDQKELLTILPKLYLIMNKVKMDEIEIIRIIDVLEEIKKQGQLEKINPELIDLVIRITNKDNITLEGTLYFSIILKHVTLPYNLNICDKDYNLMMFLSEFEILLELINKMLNKEDLVILDKYNHELKEVILRYKEVREMYKKHVTKDIILSFFISHFASMLYFKLDDYEYDYDLLIEAVDNIIFDNATYQKFIDYCCSYGLHKNFTRIPDDLTGIELEYIVSNDMLKYIFDWKKQEEKKKRK